MSKTQDAIRAKLEPETAPIDALGFAIAASQAISLKRIADAIEAQGPLPTEIYKAIYDTGNRSQ